MDTEYLRQHYAMLSDEGLLAVDRADLVAAAQKCYDDELERRQLHPETKRSHREGAASSRAELSAADQKPEWFDDGAQVYSAMILPGAAADAQQAAEAADALRRAGIPCYLEVCELPQQEESAFAAATHQWRLLVPGKLNLRATSVLEEEIFNPNIESEWKAHLEHLSDDELAEMNPQLVYSGLFDRIERITRAYEQEMLRRELPFE